MLRETRNRTAVLLTSATILLGACGGHSNQNYSNGSYGASTSAAPSAAAPAPTYDSTTAQNAPVQGKHHSVLGGAAAGALAGHYMGHHALMGAAAGAMIQHHRNKKAGY